MRLSLDSEIEQAVEMPVTGEDLSIAAFGFTPGDKDLYYEGFWGNHDFASLVAVDQDSLRSRVLAYGNPFPSIQLGDFVYFIDTDGVAGARRPGEVDLCRVRRTGGGVELIADDVAYGVHEPISHEGDKLLVRTMGGGMRVFLDSATSPVAVQLVPDSADWGPRVREAAIVGETVVYIYGKERTQEVRAMRISGGPSWSLASPYRDPRSLAADNQGAYWINLADAQSDANLEGVFACEPGVSVAPTR